jgi:cytochrome c oxidase subunit 4
MASIKTYTAIFGVLMAFSTVQFVFEVSGLLEDNYGPIMAVILVLSTLKAMAVAGWYMHIIEEPRSITYVALAGVLGVIALTVGATYSVS